VSVVSLKNLLRARIEDHSRGPAAEAMAAAG